VRVAAGCYRLVGITIDYILTERKEETVLFALAGHITVGTCILHM
jgi:hypothetical protein